RSSNPASGSSNRSAGGGTPRARRASRRSRRSGDGQPRPDSLPTLSAVPRACQDGAVPVLLIVHHTASPALHSLFDSVMTGAREAAAADPSAGVEIVARPALTAGAVDVLGADAYILGTPANLGYMSGALKHFFDQIYYPCLEATVRRPYACYIHGNNDTTGALWSIETATTGLKWELA